MPTKSRKPVTATIDGKVASVRVGPGGVVLNEASRLDARLRDRRRPAKRR